MESYINFYPTPKTLAEKMISGVDWRKVGSILEPSAGKGDLLDVAKNASRAATYSENLRADCIELNPELRAALKGKEYRVVHDDFLTYETEMSYDLILMNPPFDQGAKHLLKALKMQETTGGLVISLLNAETLKNPCTAERKALVNKLESIGAEVEYCQGEFSSAERSTEVEVAIVKAMFEPRQKVSFIFEELRKAQQEKEAQQWKEETRVAEKDFIAATVKRYQLEERAGLKLIEEWEAMAPYIQSAVKSEYTHPIIELKVNAEGERGTRRNVYVREVRRKYWEAIFRNPMFTDAMPSDMCNTYLTKVNELCEYEFSFYNIKEIQRQMVENMVAGIEQSILKLFEELTHEYSWSPEFGKNIHYYNGWATNKAYYINRKVILPCYGIYRDRWISKGKEFDPDWTSCNKIYDIEKALDYLAGCPGRRSNTASALQEAKRTQNTKNIETHHFTITFYKKNTMHIVFKDPELIKRLNIFAGKHFNMLPPCYGTKSYRDMSPKERAVVDEFDGGESAYEAVRAEYESKYKLDIQKSAPLMIAG